MLSTRRPDGRLAQEPLDLAAAAGEGGGKRSGIRQSRNCGWQRRLMARAFQHQQARQLQEHVPPLRRIPGRRRFQCRRRGLAWRGRRGCPSRPIRTPARPGQRDARPGGEHAGWSRDAPNLTGLGTAIDILRRRLRGCHLRHWLATDLLEAIRDLIVVEGGRRHQDTGTQLRSPLRIEPTRYS